MTLGSLFDGIAGFPLAASYYGIKTLWASEIEPHCVEITKRHFPLMEHLGSVTDINGAEIPPVDIITFGSPCQDLSVAGKQKGLSGERSGLFLEAVRIIREMRCATNGIYPAYAIWENVPGAFSSNKGGDFRRVLEALAESEIPMPKSRKWARSGMVRLRDREIAWRTIDAQYWGVPQRRKRIYLVVSFGSRSAGEILFKPESLLGYTPQSGKEGQEAPVAVRSCVKSAGFIDRAPAEAGSIGYQEEMCPTLRAGLLPAVMCAGFSGQNSITATPEYYISDSGVNSTLVSKGPSAVIYKLLSRWIARRLTPRECERLQGFPDDWTRFDTTSNEIKDFHRYKALGNSIAIPCAVRVFRGIEACERKEREVT